VQLLPVVLDDAVEADEQRGLRGPVRRHRPEHEPRGVQRPRQERRGPLDDAAQCRAEPLVLAEQLVLGIHEAVLRRRVREALGDVV
jgi:hypothetical protein